MKKKLLIFFVVISLMIVAFSWTIAGKMSIYPLQDFSLSNKDGLDCGEGRFRMEPLSFVQEKIYVGGFEDSSNPKGYDFSLRINQRRINIYRISDGFSVAEEVDGKLKYGWTSRGFSTGRLTLLCEKSRSSKKN